MSLALIWSTASYLINEEEYEANSFGLKVHDYSVDHDCVQDSKWMQGESQCDTPILNDNKGFRILFKSSSSARPIVIFCLILEPYITSLTISNASSTSWSEWSRNAYWQLFHLPLGDPTMVSQACFAQLRSFKAVIT